MDTQTRVVNFLAILTGLVVLVYIGTASAQLIAAKIAFAEYASTVGPVAGMLIGYFVRDQRGA